ncbi:unnamed protein product [Laminaria digitata]
MEQGGEGRNEGGGGGRTHLFLALVVRPYDHAPLSRRSTVPTSINNINRDTSNIWALNTRFLYITWKNGLGCVRAFTPPAYLSCCHYHRERPTVNRPKISPKHPLWCVYRKNYCVGPNFCLNYAVDNNRRSIDATFVLFRTKFGSRSLIPFWAYLLR